MRWRHQLVCEHRQSWEARITYGFSLAGRQWLVELTLNLNTTPRSALDYDLMENRHRLGLCFRPCIILCQRCQFLTNSAPPVARAFRPCPACRIHGRFMRVVERPLASRKPAHFLSPTIGISTKVACFLPMGHCQRIYHFRIRHTQSPFRM